jgi:hypothetical protein
MGTAKGGGGAVDVPGVGRLDGNVVAALEGIQDGDVDVGDALVGADLPGGGTGQGGL